MKRKKTVNTYIDTLGIRYECDNKKQREDLFNLLIDVLLKGKSIGTRYNKERSDEYNQITDLLYGNTKLASLTKGYYKIKYNLLNPDRYYLNIKFYGLKSYNEKRDEATILLVRTIIALLNTYNIDFRLTELDIAMDIESKIDNILVVCTTRSPNVLYHQLGDINANGKNIQEYDGTYYIEKFESFKKQKNAMSRAYFYDKRLKEKTKYNRDIGFNLTRFEVKLQTGFFVKNKFGFIPIYKVLQKYAVLEFEDIKQKECLIQKLNSITTSKQRKKAIANAIVNNYATPLTQKMNLVGKFLREIDTIKFNTQGKFVSTKHEGYLECMSRFNRKY
jgi:hypothetical protein